MEGRADKRPAVVGVAEIAAALGVSRQRVDQLRRSDPDFPRPLAELVAGRVWLEAEVLEWASESGRLR